jgi:hypothetical protein
MFRIFRAALQAGPVHRPGRRRLFAAVLPVMLIAAAPPARAEDLPTLVLRQHRFVPDRIVVPAHEKFELRVQNTDDKAEDFESSSLNRIRLVPPGGTITLHLGPLEPGDYHFRGDFHQDTAQGVLVAK